MDELLGQLRGGQLESEGTFTLDPVRALEVLRQHQFLDPTLYTLPLYQAAVQLGATEVRVDTTPDRCHFELPGATLEAPNHRTLAGQLLKSSGGLRLLAMAVFTALNLPKARVEVTGDGLRSVWTPTDYHQEPTAPGPVTVTVATDRVPDLSRCLYGPIPVNGLVPPPFPKTTALWRKLNGPEKLPPLGEHYEVKAPWSGLLTYGLEGPGEVILVVGGITAPEKLKAPEGVGGVIASDRLRWDMSWHHPVQDDVYREIVQYLENLDPELARQAALDYTGLEGPAIRELIFRNLRRLRKNAPPELWNAPLFLQASGEPMNLKQITSPVRVTKRFWELKRPTGAVQLRSGQELALLSSFVTVEDGDPWLERRKAAEEREETWRNSEPQTIPDRGVPLKDGALWFGEGGLTLLKEHRYLGTDTTTLPRLVTGVVNCDNFTPDEDWAGVRPDAVWRRVHEALETALHRLYETTPAEPPAGAEELVYSWLEYWRARPRKTGWDDATLVLWPIFPTLTGVRLSWAEIRAQNEVWFVEEPVPPRLPRVNVLVLQVSLKLRKLLQELLPGCLRSMLDEHPERPRNVVRRGPIPAGRLLLRQKVLRGDLAVPWEPKPPYLGEPGLEVHVTRQGGYLGSVWLPLGYGPVVAEVELPGVEARDGQLIQGEVFHQQMAPLFERARKLAVALSSAVHRYSDHQWAAVRLYLLRQLAHELANPRGTDEVWGVLSKSPLFPCADGQNVGYADFLLSTEPIGWVDEPTVELNESPILLLSDETLTLAQRILKDRLVDRRPDLKRLRQQESEVVMFVSLPPGETLLATETLGLLKDASAPSRIEVFEGRRRVKALDLELPIPIVAAVEHSDVESLQTEARQMIADHDELPEEYRIEVATRDPGLRDLPLITGLLRPLRLNDLPDPIDFLNPKSADRIYALQEIEPFLRAFGRQNPPILSRAVERVLPGPLRDLALEVERAFWEMEGREFPPVQLELAFPGRKWLARSPIVGKLLGEVGLPEDWKEGGGSLWLLPRGRVRVPAPVCAVVWSEHDLPDERLREALPLLEQTLRKDVLRRVPRPELEAWCGG